PRRHPGRRGRRAPGRRGDHPVGRAPGAGARGRTLRPHARRRPGRHHPRHQHPGAGRGRGALAGAAAHEPARADPARGRRPLARPGAAGGALPQALRREAVRGGPRRAGVAPEPHRRRGADGRAEGPHRPRAGRRARPGAAGGPRRPVAPPPAPGRDDAAPRRRARAGRAGAGEERAGRARGARRARPGRGSVMSVPLFPRSAAGLLGCLAAVVNGVLRVAIVPVFVTPLFDRVLQAEDPAALPGVLAVAALVAVGGSLALWAQDALLGRAAARLAADWRRRLYRALLDGPPGRLPGSSGGLASRIVNDLREVETYYRYGLGTLVAESVTLVLILVLLVRADALAALALLALALPSVLALRWVGGYLERAADRSMAQSEAVGRHLQEGLKHHELVRAFGARRFMQARFEPANR